MPAGGFSGRSGTGIGLANLRRVAGPHDSCTFIGREIPPRIKRQLDQSYGFRVVHNASHIMTSRKTAEGIGLVDKTRQIQLRS